MGNPMFLLIGFSKLYWIKNVVDVVSLDFCWVFGRLSQCSTRGQNGYGNWIQSLRRQGVLMAMFCNMSPWQRRLTHFVLLVLHSRSLLAWLPISQTPPYIPFSFWPPISQTPPYIPFSFWPIISFPVYNPAPVFSLVFAFENLNMNELCIQFKRLEQNKIH